jgi:hypothetical protein
MPNNYQLPLDIANQQRQVQRRQALADAMSQRSFQPDQGQMVSGHYVSSGALGPINQIAAAMLGGYNQKKADEGQTKLGQDYQSAISNALQQYQQDRQTDPRAAAVNAAASQIPMLQEIGKEDLKGMVNQRDILNAPGASVTSRTSALTSGLVGDLKEAPKIMETNGQVVSATPEGATRLGDYRDQFGGVEQLATGPDGKPIMGQRNMSQGKNDYVPGSGVTVNTESNPVDRAVAPTVIKDIQGARNSILAAQKANDTADRFTKLISDPKVITGAFAEPRAMVANIANTLFPGDSAALAKTQQAIKASADLALQASRSAEGQGAVSDYERSLFQKASGGDLNMGADALRDLMVGIKKTAAITAKQSQQFLDSAATNPLYKPYVDMYGVSGYTGQGDVQPMTPTPEGQAAPQQAAPTGPTNYTFNPATGKLEPQ